jgi:hypothetical protein
MASGDHWQVCGTGEVDSRVDSQSRTFLHFTAIRDGLLRRDGKPGYYVERGLKRVEKASEYMEAMYSYGSVVVRPYEQ